MRRGGGEDEQYRGRPPYAFPLTAGGNAPPDGEEAGDEAEARAHDARHLDGPPPGRRHPARAAQREEARGIGQDSAAEYLRAGLTEAGPQDADDPEHRRGRERKNDKAQQELSRGQFHGVSLSSSEFLLAHAKEGWAAAPE